LRPSPQSNRDKAVKKIRGWALTACRLAAMVRPSFIYITSTSSRVPSLSPNRHFGAVSELQTLAVCIPAMLERRIVALLWQFSAVSHGLPARHGVLAAASKAWGCISSPGSGSITPSGYQAAVGWHASHATDHGSQEHCVWIDIVPRREKPFADAKIPL